MPPGCHPKIPKCCPSSTNFHEVFCSHHFRALQCETGYSRHNHQEKQESLGVEILKKPWNYWRDGNQKSGERSPLEGTVETIRLFTTGLFFCTIQMVVGNGISSIITELYLIGLIKLHSKSELQLSTTEIAFTDFFWIFGHIRFVSNPHLLLGDLKKKRSHSKQASFLLKPVDSALLTRREGSLETLQRSRGSQRSDVDFVEWHLHGTSGDFFFKPINHPKKVCISEVFQANFLRK